MEKLSYDDLVLAIRIVVKQIANIARRPAPPDETIDKEIQLGIPKAFPTLFLIKKYYDKRFDLETEFNLAKRDKLRKLKSDDEIREELEEYDRQKKVDEQFLAELEANEQPKKEQIEAAVEEPIPENISEEEKIERIVSKLIGRAVNISRLLYNAVRFTPQGTLLDRSLTTVEEYDKALDAYEKQIKSAALDLSILTSKLYLSTRGSSFRKPFVEAYVKYVVLSLLARNLKPGILPGNIMTKYNDDKKSFFTVFNVKEDALPIIKEIDNRIKSDKLYGDFIARIGKLNK